MVKTDEQLLEAAKKVAREANEAHLAAEYVVQALKDHISDEPIAIPKRYLRTKVNGIVSFGGAASAQAKALVVEFDEVLAARSGDREPPPGGPRP